VRGKLKAVAEALGYGVEHFHGLPTDFRPDAITRQ
jgi:hypothetical protein